MWAYKNYQQDNKESFEQKKDIFEALKPWLDNERWNYIEKQKEESKKAREEVSQEAKDMFKAYMDKTGIKLPEGVEIDVQSEEDQESSEVVE